MSADFTPEKEDYKILTPFKMQVLTNFPYIEADFDALTNYQLLCKVVEYLNNVIANENELTEQVNSLYNAYVALQNYVNTEISTFESTVNNTVQSLEDYMNNYFDNLDVQEEINHKLDEMTEDGTLTNLIGNYVDPIFNTFTQNINDTITVMNTRINTIDDKVDSASSGSPKGVYATLAALQAADPNHDYIYVVSADGYWYYYDSTLGDWTAGGLYQAAEDSETVNELVDKVEVIEEALKTKIGTEIIRELSLYDNSEGTIPTTNFANTRRWFFNTIFKKGQSIKSISFKNYRVSSETVTFEVWEKSGNTLTKVKTVDKAVSGQDIYNVVIDYVGTSDYMISFIQTLGTVSYDPENGSFMIVSTDVSGSTETLDYSTLSAFDNLKPCVTIEYTEIGHDNIILVGDGQKYTEIQEALDDINDDSENNPYTIILMPNKKPYQRFSMIRDLTDPYPWNNIRPRYISIIGIDKSHTIVRSDTGNYQSPCGEVMTNGIIKNITFVMTHDNQDPTATQGGYCLHIDCRTLNDVGYNMIIEDCDFTNNSGPCLGIGMHENCSLIIKRCNFKTTLAATYNPHTGYRNLVDYGAIFAHTSVLSTSQNQRLTFENCVGTCAEGNKSLWIAAAGEYSPSTADFMYTILNNIFWNNTLNSNGYYIDTSLPGNPMNYGNNN